MNFSYLVPSGNPLHIFLLHRHQPDRDGPLVVRPRYRDLICESCGKLDEIAACQRGIDDDVAVRSRKDFVATFEWLNCVSPKFQQVVRGAGIVGLDFVPIPKSAGFAVIAPRRLVPTDLAKTQMRLIGQPCARCGRYRESCYKPALAAMELPPDERGIYMPTVRPEKGDCRMSTLVATEQV